MQRLGLQAIYRLLDGSASMENTQRANLCCEVEGGRRQPDMLGRVRAPVQAHHRLQMPTKQAHFRWRAGSSLAVSGVASEAAADERSKICTAKGAA